MEARNIKIVVDTLVVDTPKNDRNNDVVRFRRCEDVDIGVLLMRGCEEFNSESLKSMRLEIMDIGDMNQVIARDVKLLMRKEVSEFGDRIVSGVHGIFSFRKEETLISAGEKWMRIVLTMEDDREFTATAGWIIVEENYSVETNIEENVVLKTRDEVFEVFDKVVGIKSEMVVLKGEGDSLLAQVETLKERAESCKNDAYLYLEQVEVFSRELGVFRSESEEFKDETLSYRDEALLHMNKAEEYAIDADEARQLAEYYAQNAQTISDPTGQLGKNTTAISILQKGYDHKGVIGLGNAGTLNIPNSKTVGMGTSFSVCVKFRFKSFVATSSIFANYSYGVSNQLGIMWEWSAQSSMWIRYRNTSGATNTSMGIITTDYLDNNMHSLVIVGSSGSIKVYIDNVKVKEEVVTLVDISQTGIDWAMGTNSSTTYELSDFIFFRDKALTTDEIMLYHRGEYIAPSSIELSDRVCGRQVLDKSSNGWNGTLIGASSGTKREDIFSNKTKLIFASASSQLFLGTGATVVMQANTRLSEIQVKPLTNNINLSFGTSSSGTQIATETTYTADVWTDVTPSIKNFTADTNLYVTAHSTGFVANTNVEIRIKIERLK